MVLRKNGEDVALILLIRRNLLVNYTLNNSSISWRHFQIAGRPLESIVLLRMGNYDEEPSEKLETKVIIYRIGKSAAKLLSYMNNMEKVQRLDVSGFDIKIKLKV